MNPATSWARGAYDHEGTFQTRRGHGALPRRCESRLSGVCSCTARRLVAGTPGLGGVELVADRRRRCARPAAWWTGCATAGWTSSPTARGPIVPREALAGLAGDARVRVFEGPGSGTTSLLLNTREGPFADARAAPAGGRGRSTATPSSREGELGHADPTTTLFRGGFAGWPERGVAAAPAARAAARRVAAHALSSPNGPRPSGAACAASSGPCSRRAGVDLVVESAPTRRDSARAWRPDVGRVLPVDARHALRPVREPPDPVRTPPRRGPRAAALRSGRTTTWCRLATALGAPDPAARRRLASDDPASAARQGGALSSLSSSPDAWLLPPPALTASRSVPTGTTWASGGRASTLPRSPGRCGPRAGPAAPAPVPGAPHAPRHGSEGGRGPLPAEAGWNATLVLDNGKAGVWTVASLKVFERLGCPEIVGLDDKGRCIVLTSYSGKWTPIDTVRDGKWLGGIALADVDPEASGKELYVAGREGQHLPARPARRRAPRRLPRRRAARPGVNILLAGDLGPDVSWR